MFPVLAIRYQLPQVWPPSFNRPGFLQKRVDQQKSKMELETKFLGTISLIDTI
jgi:hypothetical protein